jgi:serine protease Do
VREIMKGSPASKGGLKEGDIILKVESAQVQDAADLRNMVADLKPGGKYNFEILRDGKKSTLGIKIGAKPDDGSGASDDGGAVPDSDEDDGSFFSKKLGIHFGALDKEARARYNIPNDQQGVVLTRISNGSSAAENNLAEGMVLSQYKRQSDGSFVKIEDPKKFLNMLKTLKPGEKIAFRVFAKGRTEYIALKAEE